MRFFNLILKLFVFISLLSEDKKNEMLNRTSKIIQTNVEKNDSKFVVMKMPYIKNISLIKYITNPSIEKKEIVAYIMDSYKFLLNSLSMLNENGVIHFDFKIPNILIGSKTKTPIIIDFGLSIPIEKLNPTNYSKYFYAYSASYYIWPVDVHIINYVTNVNSILTYDELVILVNTSIRSNPALQIFSEDFIKKFKENSLPEITKSAGGMFFKIPASFNLKFMFNGAENKKISKVAESVLTSIDVNYSPNSWSAFSDGAPVQTQLSLSFKEIEVITKQKLQKGFSSTTNDPTATTVDSVAGLR